MAVQGRVDGRSLGDLVKDVAAGTQTLISQEFRLAKLEMKENLSEASKGLAVVAAAAILGLIGLIVLAATCVLLLALVLPSWLAALIVTVLFLGVAGVLGLIGKNMLTKANPAPKETIQSLKEDQEWLKQQIR